MEGGKLRSNALSLHSRLALGQYSVITLISIEGNSGIGAYKMGKKKDRNAQTQYKTQPHITQHNTHNNQLEPLLPSNFSLSLNG